MKPIHSIKWSSKFIAIIINRNQSWGVDSKIKWTLIIKLMIVDLFINAFSLYNFKKFAKLLKWTFMVSELIWSKTNASVISYLSLMYKTFCEKSCINKNKSNSGMSNCYLCRLSSSLPDGPLNRPLSKLWEEGNSFLDKWGLSKTPMVLIRLNVGKPYLSL